MGEKSKIEWCDATVNFWWGCTKVSPGCANCYAETLSQRFGDDIWGKGKPRKKIKGAVKMAERLHRARLVALDHMDEMAGTSPRVFCSSMSDWLDPEVPLEWLAELLDTIRRTPHLDWLLLTKRPELWRRRLQDVWLSLQETGTDTLSLWIGRWLGSKHAVVGFDPVAPHNVWIGTSVEDQERADKRIPELLRIPARVRFLSCEPLLGAVDLKIGDPCHRTAGSYHAKIDWVIVGGESGPGARPMNPFWVRSLRDQCHANKVPFFFKQWGEWQTPGMSNVAACPNPEPDKVHIFDDPYQTFSYRSGKLKSGRELDGVKHHEFPK